MVVTIYINGNLSGVVEIIFLVLFGSIMPFYAIASTWHAGLATILFFSIFYFIYRAPIKIYQVLLFSVLFGAWSFYGVMCISIVTGE